MQNVYPLLLILSLLLVPVTSRAQEPTTVNDWTLSISPTDLVFHYVEISTERSVSDWGGFGGHLGLGEINLSFLGAEARFLAFGAGVQGSYYFIGDFDIGLQLGGSLAFTHVTGNATVRILDTTYVIQRSVNAVRLGPYIGAKYTFSFGLTSTFQVGGAIVFDKQNASSGNVRVRGSLLGSGLTLNWTLGWAF